MAQLSLSLASTRPTLEPRPYQREALDALHAHICTKTTNPCIVIPTGGGKSVLIAWAIQMWKDDYPPLRVAILAHRKELVAQNSAELAEVWPSANIGIYAAGLGRRDMDNDIIYASIDSVHKKGGDFKPFDIIIVDESHRIPPSGDGKYRQFIAMQRLQNKNLRIVGFTATPFRMTGPLCHKDHILQEICYEANIFSLIQDNYLCKLWSRRGEHQPDLSQVKRNHGGDYVVESLAKAVDTDAVVRQAVSDAMQHIQLHNRKHAIWFCVDVDHCSRVSRELRLHGVSAPAITASTPHRERDRVAADFKSGRLKAICNVNVYTEGFNAKLVDCIVLLRPTLSKGLYQQMCGRGLRVHPEKADCVAEGQRVLTDQGLVPIERVTTSMLVWDGAEFVGHDGAICKGEQNVIEYAGLTATADHRVWTARGKMRFGDCAQDEVPIFVTGYDGKAIRKIEDCFTRDKASFWSENFGVDGVPLVRPPAMASSNQSSAGRRWLSQVWQKTQLLETLPGCSGVVAKEVCSGQAPVYQLPRQTILGLRRQGDNLRLQDPEPNGSMGNGQSFVVQSSPANRPHRQQLGVRSGEPENGRAPCQHEQPAMQQALPRIERIRRRVWDIINAGPRHRFTCEGLLVSNCMVLDYSHCIDEHGPIDALGPGDAPLYDCGKCGNVFSRQIRKCPHCGWEIPKPVIEKLEAEERERRLHEIKASNRNILSGEPEEIPVEEVRIHRHIKDGMPDSLRIEYRCGLCVVREWVCLDHQGFAGQKAKTWWTQRFGPPVPSVNGALENLFLANQLKEVTKSVTVVQRGKYREIIKHTLNAGSLNAITP